jgi:hypothetical protein
MTDRADRRSAIVAWLILVGVAFVFPIGAVLLGYWVFEVSLPTLMFISFVLLFIGAFKSYPVRRGDEERIIILMVGQTSGSAVMLLILVRLLSQRFVFTWM